MRNHATLGWNPKAFLVAKANAGGELGGLNEAPTVDATHSGSAHRADAEQFHLEGSNLVEVTTTSATPVDLLSVTGLNIPAATPIMVIAVIRKSAGAAANANIGLKLNTTLFFQEGNFTLSTDAVGSGLLQAWIGGRVANYLRPGHMVVSGTGIGPLLFRADNDVPTVAITDVVVTGFVSTASISVGVDELRVYALPTT